MRIPMAVLLLGLAGGACKPKPKPEPEPPADVPPDAQPAITDREWSLATLGDNQAPLGNGGKPVTIRLQSSDQRAMGFAGCNQFSGPYTMTGDSLSFGPAISTKMACEQGMDVETGFLSMLNDVTSYQVTDTSLTLLGPGGPLARFR